MTIQIPPAFAEALRLTRSGDLAGATARIQAALAGAPLANAPAPPAGSGATIDLTAERVTFAPRRAKGSAEEFTPPGAGSFSERSYRGPHGSMSYKLYVPAGAAAGLPLLVLLHGCTQSPDDFARGTGMNALADELGFLVAYPGQTNGANPQKCWNWFRPGDQQRDAGEPALIAGITREVLAEQRADASRVYVAGLSAGGAAAAIMGAGYPDLFAAIGIHSGLACGAARDLPSALAAMRSGAGAGRASIGRFVPVITFHGDRDTTVHEANAREIIAAASSAAGGPLHTTQEQGKSNGGRRFTREISADAAGRVLLEQWTIHGAGHAWSGGNKAGSYTDPTGPDASREMMRFFLAQGPGRAD